MKKFQRFLAVILAVALFAPSIISANTPTEPRLVINGVEFTNTGVIVLNGDPFISWWELAEYYAEGVRNAETGETFIFSDFFEFVFNDNSPHFTANGEPLVANRPVQLIAGIPYIPVQAWLWAYGLSVVWDEPTNTVHATSVRFIGVDNEGEHDITPFAPILIVDDRVLAALASFEGWEEFWNSETGELVMFGVNDNVAIFTMNSSYFTLNGEQISLDVPMQVIMCVLFIPVRALFEATSEIFEESVIIKWDSERRAVLIIVDESPTVSNLPQNDYHAFMAFGLYQTIRELNLQMWNAEQILREFIGFSEILENIAEEFWQMFLNNAERIRWLQREIFGFLEILSEETQWHERHDIVATLRFADSDYLDLYLHYAAQILEGDNSEITRNHAVHSFDRVLLESGDLLAMVSMEFVEITGDSPVRLDFENLDRLWTVVDLFMQLRAIPLAELAENPERLQFFDDEIMEILLYVTPHELERFSILSELSDMINDYFLATQRLIGVEYSTIFEGWEFEDLGILRARSFADIFTFLSFMLDVREIGITQQLQDLGGFSENLTSQNASKSDLEEMLMQLWVIHGHMEYFRVLLIAAANDSEFSEDFEFFDDIFHSTQSDIIEDLRSIADGLTEDGHSSFLLTALLLEQDIILFFESWADWVRLAEIGFNMPLSLEFLLDWNEEIIEKIRDLMDTISALLDRNISAIGGLPTAGENDWLAARKREITDFRSQLILYLMIGELWEFDEFFGFLANFVEESEYAVLIGLTSFNGTEFQLNFVNNLGEMSSFSSPTRWYSVELGETWYEGEIDTDRMFVSPVQDPLQAGLAIPFSQAGWGFDENGELLHSDFPSFLEVIFQIE
ncbi:MAG: copper amine oxidase N-terminal domain-containing protein [Turicibacter sp.]|nr:copper amine oxidase N-terminal domain-containing protein [Turicibacter sp.]